MLLLLIGIETTIQSFHSKSLQTDANTSHLSSTETTSLKCPNAGCVPLRFGYTGYTSPLQMSALSNIVTKVATLNHLNSTEYTFSPYDDYSSFSDDLVRYANKTLFGVVFCVNDCLLSSAKTEMLDHIDYRIYYNVTNARDAFNPRLTAVLSHDPPFIKLKNSIDQAIIAAKTNATITIETDSFPIIASRIYKNSDSFSMVGGFYLYLPFMSLYTMFLIDLVAEKENHLKNFVHLYGMTRNAYWTANYIYCAALSATLALITIIFAHILGIHGLTNVNCVVWFLLFFLFSFTVQNFACLTSLFLEKEATANGVYC